MDEKKEFSNSLSEFTELNILKTILFLMINSIIPLLTIIKYFY